MRSWKTPALLAALGICGLGTLAAQNPMLPMAPTPIDMSSSPPMLSAPLPETFGPSSDLPSARDYPGAATPMHSYEAMEQPLSQDPGYGPAPMMDSSSSLGCNDCAAAPVASCHTCEEPAPVSTCNSCAVPQQMMAAPACGGCQGGSGGVSYGQSGYGQMSYGQSHLMGSGSGVASGLLSPNANSGGLHTRYPYYNYRHPWYYQGPPSQNVTIVW